MPTIAQLVRKGRLSISKKSKSAALDSSPQKGVFAQGYILLHLKNQILQCEK